MRATPLCRLVPLLPLAFAACDPEGPQAPPEPVSAFYACRGEPGYAQSWEEILRDLRDAGELDSLDRTLCRDPAGNPPLVSEMRMVPSTAYPGNGTDSVRVRTLVLDARCRPLTEYESAISIPPASVHPTVFLGWNTRLSDGTRAPSGEYFLNSEWSWSDGRKDTTWSKIGVLQSACEG